jgi:hypothetical protein
MAAERQKGEDAVWQLGPRKKGIGALEAAIDFDRSTDARIPGPESGLGPKKKKARKWS